LIFCTGFLQAATIELKNGDRITGSILKSDGKILIVKTESAGDVSIALAAVRSFTSDTPVYVLTSDGRTFNGKVVASESALEVTTKEGTTTVSLAEVQSMYDEATYQKEVEQYINPGWADLWSGFADVGLSLARGNSDTTNLAVGANAVRITKRDKTSLYFASLYATNDTIGESVTTANLLRGGGRYEYNVTDRFFTFAFSDLEHDELQQLDLRWVLGGGAGWYLVKNDRSQFQIFGGASYNRESFADDITRNSGEVLAGEEFTYKFNDRVSLFERFVIFPNLSETGEFRLNFDAGLQTKINDRFGWQLTFSDRYLSNPVPGFDENDIILTTGVRVTFGG
jgi:putative salt-induced outer membrane protein YdiY